MIRNFNYVFSFLILFFVFQVNANQCNEELVKDLPPTLPTSHYSPTELKDFVQRLDKVLFKQMDENIDLWYESVEIWKKYKTEVKRYEEENKVFEEKHGINTISLPCNQKQKIVNQMWEDYDNMATPGYYAIICNHPQGVVLPIRKFKYSKKIKPCGRKNKAIKDY